MDKDAKQQANKTAEKQAENAVKDIINCYPLICQIISQNKAILKSVGNSRPIISFKKQGSLPFKMPNLCSNAFNSNNHRFKLLLCYVCVNLPEFLLRIMFEFEHNT